MARLDYQHLLEQSFVKVAAEYDDDGARLASERKLKKKSLTHISRQVGVNLARYNHIVNVGKIVGLALVAHSYRWAFKTDSQ